MEVKAGVLDRIEQSFVLYKNNFVDFFVPIFIYKFISFLFFGVVFMGFAISSLSSLKMTQFDLFTFLNNPKVVILISLGMIVLIIYLLLYIPVILALTKSIKQAINGESVTTKENLFYGFKNLNNSFKTYWYIFAYVALIPSIIFIIGGISFNLGYFLGNLDILIGGLDIFKSMGIFFMVFGVILFIFFSIYRGTKSVFPIYSAVNNDSFTKQDFTNSILITNNNFSRIIGNFLLVGVIIGLLSGIISGILGFNSVSDIDYTNIKTIDDIKKIAGNFNMLSSSLSGFVNTIINTIGSVFVIVFTYLFYLRLKNETSIITQSSENKTLIISKTEAPKSIKDFKTIDSEALISDNSKDIEL